MKTVHRNMIAFMPVLGLAWILCFVSPSIAADATPEYPDPVANPGASLMLTGDWAPSDHHKIDFDKLPRLPVEHIVVSDVRARKGVNQHNYLIHYDGRFWAMWSDGPEIEDRVGQVVKYSTSPDGMNWDEPRLMTPYPPGSGPDSPHYNTRNKAGFRYISRGFWLRDGQLLALASLDEAAGFFGPSLTLHAFRWNPATKLWDAAGVVQDDAINNFPPKKLPTGEWAMSRRKHDYRQSGVEFLIGGKSALNEWKSFPVMADKASALKAEEPLWWTLPDGNLMSLFRDNGGGHYLYRAFSTDHGRTWSNPARTDFPDATSKLHGLRLSDGRYVLVSNPHPKRRDPLTLAVSDDGLVFDKLFYLVGGRHVDYPHVLEHDGSLYIAHTGGKRSIEIERVRLADLNAARMPMREKPDATPQTSSALLKEEDWQRASLKPIAPGEIDALIFRERAARNIEPAALTTDEQFIRRVTLDLTGQLPTAADITTFVASTDSAKRPELIDHLLDTDAFARHWARYWRDVVSCRITNRRSMGLTRSFEEWLYEQFLNDRNWGEITRDILTAEGELRFSRSVSPDSALVKQPGWQARPNSEGGELFFLVAHDTDEAEERAAETSRVFLGIQIQCAQCHDHFTEPWKRAQFHELAAYFSRIKYQQLFDDKKLVGVQLVTVPDREHKMTSLEEPESFCVMHPRVLDGRSPDRSLGDHERRQALADVVVDKQNYWFAAAFVNRVWGVFMGESFYKNVDDMGLMKEVIFAEVLTRLTGAFRGTDYDIKAMFLAITNSEAYQRQYRQDEKSGERLSLVASCPAPLRADVLWDSLEHVLGRLGASQYHTKGGKRFNTSILEGKFKAEFDFDPSLKNEDVEGTIPQSLFLMNNADLNRRIQAVGKNLLGRVLKDSPDDAEAVTSVYLRVLARRPTDRELSKCRAYIARIENRAEAFEDVLWALINSTEFQTKR
jgi:hypothetical protein